jgi:hypothetical protein
MLRLGLRFDLRLIQIVLWWIVLFGRSRVESRMERGDRRLTVLRRRLRGSGGKYMRRSWLLMRIWSEALIIYGIHEYLYVFMKLKEIAATSPVL